MTLATTLYVHEFVPPNELLAVLRGHLAQYDEQGRTPDQHIPIPDGLSYRDDARMIGNNLGQGLPAILCIYYGPDGPLVTAEQSAAHDGDCEQGCDDVTNHEPPHFASINWDTAYGYKDARVGGCADLHARLIVHAGEWLDARGVNWSWVNEFTGERHHKYDGLFEFMGNGDEAHAWFTTKVEPAIAALAAGER